MSQTNNKTAEANHRRPFCRSIGFALAPVVRVATYNPLVERTTEDLADSQEEKQGAQWTTVLAVRCLEP